MNTSTIATSFSQHLPLLPPPRVLLVLQTVPSAGPNRKTGRDRQTDRDSETERERDRQTDRETERQRERDRELE